MGRNARSWAAIGTGLAVIGFGWPMASGGAGPTPATASADPLPRAADCYTSEDVPLTVEEQRLADPLPGTDTGPASVRFIEAAGLDSLVASFERRLCRVDDVDRASELVRASGARLWRTAVRRAQGDVELGEIDRYDDRPLYWARTTMSAALRQWDAGFELTGTQRLALVRILSYESRGIEQVRYPQAATGSPGC